MTIYTNPVRDEALTVTATHITRWNLNDVRDPLVQAEHGPGWQPPLAVLADGASFVLPMPERHGPYDERVVELRRWDDFHLIERIRLPDSGVALTALASSPDGRWLATADMYENIYLLRTGTTAVVSVVPGGECTSALTFSPDGAYLAALCTFQGGGFVGVWQVDEQRLHEPVLKMDRSSLKWPIMMDGGDGGLDMADTFGTLAVSPDARLLAACVRSHWCPWAGEIAVYELATGQPLWRTPLYARAGGGRLGSTVLFTADGAGIVYGSATGEVTILSAEDGSPRRSITVAAGTDTATLAADRLSRGIWATGPDERPYLITL